MTLKIDAFPHSGAFDEINEYLKASDSQRQQALKMAKSKFAFKLRNKEGEEQAWHIDLKDKGEVRKGLGQDPTVTLSLSDDDFGNLVSGKGNAQRMFMSGSLRVSGDIMKANVLPVILKKAMQSKAKI